MHGKVNRMIGKCFALLFGFAPHDTCSQHDVTQRARFARWQRHVLRGRKRQYIGRPVALAPTLIELGYLIVGCQ